MGGKEARSSSRKKLTSNGSKSEPSSQDKKALKKQKKQDCRRILAAILTRVLFAAHAGFALWRVSIDYPKEFLYFLSIGLVCLLFEMVFALIVRRGKEYKWFCPSVLFYLMSVVPCLWLLELSRIEQAGICNVNVTSFNASSLPIQQGIASALYPNFTSPNRTRRGAAWAAEAGQILSDSENLLKRLRRESSSDDKPKEKKNKRRRRKKQKSATNAPVISTFALPESIKSVNGTAEYEETGSPIKGSNYSAGSADAIADNTTLTSQQTTSDKATSLNLMTSKVKSPSTPHQTFTNSKSRTVTSIAMTSQVSETGGNDVIGLDNLGQKIKDGFSSIEKETANILNKTKEAIGQLSKVVAQSDWMILLLHQVLLFVLVIGRWLLPKGEITRDQLSQLLLVFIGVGADILEFVTETIDGDDLDQTSCSMILHYVIYGVWSWSLLQFTLVLTASKSRKTRVGFDQQFVPTTNQNGCCGNSIFASADLWGILVTLFLQDVPFLATRLYILIVYDMKHQMMIFFTGKNALVVILQIYRIVVLKLSRKHAQEDTVDESEIEPLRGTLTQLARRAAVVSGDGEAVGDDIRDATFKRSRDGSVVVKIHLEGEETLRKKRKKSAQSNSRT